MEWPLLAGAVRVGLVAVGTAFAIVGAGVIASMVLTVVPSTATRIGDASAEQVDPSTAALMLLPAVPTGDGSAEMVWSASAPTEVWWYEEAPCTPQPGWCIEGGPLANWSGAPTTGEFAWQGSVASLYCLYVEDSGDHAVNVSASFAESYPSASHLLPLVPFVWTMVGGSLLLGVGGMATYLGLFLPGGVYGAPAAATLDPIWNPDDPTQDDRFPPVP